MPAIAILEPDSRVRKDMVRAVQELGHQVVTAAAAGGRFLDMLTSQTPDLAILELHGQGFSGWDVLQNLRQAPLSRRVLVIAVAAELSPRDVVRALDMGADDFIHKPLDMGVVQARLTSLLRRADWRRDAPAEEPPIRLGRLIIDKAQHVVLSDGQPVFMRPMEFTLLHYLCRNADRVVPRSMLLEHVWKGERSMRTRTVDKHIETLRKRLGSSLRIETVYGVGYRILPAAGTAGGDAPPAADKPVSRGKGGRPSRPPGRAPRRGR